MKLLDRVRDVGLRRHLSPLTIECYQRWARAFLLYCAGDIKWVAGNQMGRESMILEGRRKTAYGPIMRPTGQRLPTPLISQRSPGRFASEPEQVAAAAL